MKRNVDLYLEDILEAIQAIETYIEGINFKEFKDIPLVIDAVLRQLTIIGEASNHLPENMKNKMNVPWEKVVATRNRLIHGYFDVGLKVTWETAKKDIQELKKEIKKYLKSKA
jgi:uncharacterized protein with HEPN domain